MRAVSKKQAVINRRLQQVYREIDAEREPVCEGCGRNEGLSHSHLISQKDCKDYGLTELIYDKQNIRLHCMYECHHKWESRHLPTILTMHDGEENIAYVRSKSEQLYQKIMRTI